ncbi:DUF6157 family protein [Maritalea sp.]|uniref:DUF6157 family protein n=1 Tax=Maritalea sp. TaxID=2003361 RepID=UPI003EF48508
MANHTTNYIDAFIEISPDCAVAAGSAPTREGTVAFMQYERLVNAPYAMNSDELLFGIFADRKGLVGAERDAAKQLYFAKGQPCLRASPLVKSYGWGVHHDGEGRVAIYGVESEKYLALVENELVEKFKGMRSKRR